jgi:predicted site-specific integrase-resolvase
MAETNFLSPKQAGEQLGLRYGQVMRRIRSGKIAATKIDWGWVITQDEVDRLKGGQRETRKIST